MSPTWARAAPRQTRRLCSARSWAMFAPARPRAICVDLLCVLQFRWCYSTVATCVKRERRQAGVEAHEMPNAILGRGMCVFLLPGLAAELGG